jgi:hypothetical protein
MASGMLTKQGDFLTAKFLNNVNDCWRAVPCSLAVDRR